jgi:D-glycero-D-manno-heptose 1,7-bisphosphate phosphatase
MSPSAILFDRDGTLIVNVPHNADPDKVLPLPTVHEALALLRERGVPTAVVSNQSVIGRGLASADQVAATNARVESLLGPIGQFHLCPHAPWQDCQCRKPLPQLLFRAADALGLDPSEVAFVGDMGSDLDAAVAAGMLFVLVPSADTPPEVIRRTPHSAPTLLAAVQLLLAD